MSEQEKQEGQKTIVSFVSGLLIGGLLVWAFSGSPREDKKMTSDEGTNTEEATESTTEATKEATNTTPAGAAMNVGDGSIGVKDQAAGASVALNDVTYPADEGWIAVRSFRDGKVGNILGAARFSKTQGLDPKSVPLLVPTTAGNEYAVVFFTEDGNRTFNLNGDIQLEAGMAKFTAK